MSDRVHAGLAIIGDVHAHHERLERVVERIEDAGRPLAAILLVGDLSGEPDPALGWRPGCPEDLAFRVRSIEEVLAPVRALGMPVYWVPGNHDLKGSGIAGDLDGALASVPAEVGILRIAGLGGGGPDRYGSTYEWTEDELRAVELEEADVLLVHSPPRHTAIDYVSSKEGHHIGSAAMRERALAHTGLMVSGHIHESPGAQILGGRCLAVNAGGLGEPFGAAQVVFVDLERDPERLRIEAVHEDLDSGLVRRAGLEVPLALAH